MIAYNGTAGNDYLSAYNWNYQWDTFYMGAGNDTVITPSNSARGTYTSYSFYGFDGDDYFLGDTAGDYARGGVGNDTLSGHSGNDYLNGEDNNDFLYGGAEFDSLIGGNGNDRLDGGTAQDTLYGGVGNDTFVVRQGDSNANYAETDKIQDWDVRYDWIDSTIAGSSSKYAEVATTGTNLSTYYTGIVWQVEHDATLRTKDHVFLYNAQTDTGYLLSDLDRNYTFETAVTIQGAGAAADMNWSDII